MPLMRRRPLLRAAVVGGVAHHAGRVSAERNMMRDEQEQAAYAAPQPTAQPAGGMSSAVVEQLKQLGELREQGILTDEEFEQQKRKLLNAA